MTTMSQFEKSQEKARKMERAVIKCLGISEDQYKPGSLVVESDWGYERVTWECEVTWKPGTFNEIITGIGE